MVIKDLTQRNLTKTAYLSHFTAFYVVLNIYLAYTLQYNISKGTKVDDETVVFCLHRGTELHCIGSFK